MTEHPPRCLRLPLESGLGRVLVLILTLIAGTWLATVIVSPAVATSLAARIGLANLERALTWDPNNPALHIRLGRAYETVDDDKARSHFATALRLRPADASTWQRLARLADRQHDLAGAREALDAALRLDPHNVMIRWEAGLLALRWGEREQALDHFRYVMAVDP
jgi:tetratricopeptide (TPR) repeat protein